MRQRLCAFVILLTQSSSSVIMAEAQEPRLRDRSVSGEFDVRLSISPLVYAELYLLSPILIHMPEMQIPQASQDARKTQSSSVRFI